MTDNLFFEEFWEAQNLPGTADAPEPEWLAGRRFADLHVHIDPMRYVYSRAAKIFQSRVGAYVNHWLTPDYTATSSIICHTRKNRLEQVGAIFEKPSSLLRLRSAVPETEIIGVYFLRWPEVWLPVPSFITQVGVQALKIHPVQDWFPVDEKLGGLYRFARDLGLPLAIHSDDRTSESMELTRPERFAAVARNYPDLKLIILHGIYANPRKVGNGTVSRRYWGEGFKPLSRRRTLLCCLELARDAPNVFLELSIVTNKVKALLVANFVNQNPSIASKLLLGTDYPIRKSLLISQIKALNAAGMREDLLIRIADNRFCDVLAA